MPRFRPEPAREAKAANPADARPAILLVNLGTPEAPTTPALRRYLRQFLFDPRVVEIPRPIWWLVLNGIILNTRPAKSARKYAKVWMAEGSPLKVHTERQAKLLAGLFGESGNHVRVEWAMRYGAPSIGDTLDRLKADGCQRILIVPLYPQYAASTTASVMDEVASWMRSTRNLPQLDFIRDYHDHPRYIAALAASVRQHWATNNGQAEKLVMSFHGLPQRSSELGDPYQSECFATARLLAHALNLSEDRYLVTFQSRFGPAKWLQPYTQPTLERLAREGIKSVDLICPGFVADCLETLEEIAIECRNAFIAEGGQAFNYIPCLNENPAWISALAEIATSRLGRY